MIVLNVSTKVGIRRDIGIALHERGWHWGDGDSLIDKPLETTFEGNPYIALFPEDKTIKQITTITKRAPTRTEVVAAGYFIIDVLNNKGWIF